MQFDPVSGAPISQSSAGASYDAGTNVLTYTYTAAGVSKTIEVGSGKIVYDLALPTGTTVNLYSDAACTTLVPASKYTKVTDTAGHTIT